MGVKRRAAANQPRYGSRANDSGQDGDRFPWIISLACLLAGLYLFLSSTVPALRESRELRNAERNYRRAVGRVEDQTLRQRQHLKRLPSDPELMLVEFDRQGLLPEQAIQRYLDSQPAHRGGNRR